MLRGTTITAKIPNTWHYDRFNNKVVDEYEPITVNNVLIVPGATTDLEASRPEGVLWLNCQNLITALIALSATPAPIWTLTPLPRGICPWK